tara:strand:- start:152 stop:535 length:384 start_codon:yes stop_codon:yes gene_type:complete
MQNNMFQNQQTPNNSSSMNSMGRFGDNQTVHAQSGELVVPQSTLQENPELGMGLAQAFMDQGVNPYRQIVGSGSGSMNPMTGQQEFFDLGKLLKTVAPIAIGAMRSWSWSWSWRHVWSWNCGSFFSF